MCGRYALHTALTRLAEEFGVPDPDAYADEAAPGYNVAPTRMLPVCLAGEDGRRRFEPMRWGLVPSWAKDESIGNRLINARAETVAGKPAFRAAFRRRRCLVPADGFYEWQKTDGAKQPWYVQRADRRPMALAGLWEHHRREDGPPLVSFAIVTTEANEAMAHIHGRMPVIVDRDDMGAWLGGDGDPAALLRPWPAEQTLAWPVSRRVNNVRNDDPACLEPVEGDPPA